MSNKQTNRTRRRFLTDAVTGAVSAGLLGGTGSKVFADSDTDDSQSREILTRPLGKTGIRLPVVSMGVMNADNPAVLKASFDAGVRHFDTAAYYQSGKNEQMVGQVVKEMDIRNEVVIGTKIFTPNIRDATAEDDIPNTMYKLADESLARLQMDHVDILYVHNLKQPQTAKNEAIIHAMQEIKKQGKARHIGVTTHTRMHTIIDPALEAGVWEVIQTAINFTLSDYSELMASLKKAAAQGVGIIAMKTQAGSHQRSQLDFGDRYTSKTIAQASLKWVLHNPNICTAIPGYTTFEHMEQDFEVAYGLDYTENERALLGEADVKLGMGFCRQCEQCLGTCPHGVDIPTLMRTHMYAARYSNFPHARLTLAEIDPGHGLETCTTCADCIAQCQNEVDIASKITELQTMYT